MIKFKFYRPLEKIPKDGEEIIFIEKRESFGYEYFEPQIGTIEYAWDCLDENFESNGNSYFYSKDDVIDNDPYIVLDILVAGHSTAFYFFDEVICWNYPFDMDEILQGDDYGV